MSLRVNSGNLTANWRKDIRIIEANFQITCSARPTSGRSPLRVQFISQVTGQVGSQTRLWDFGDGNSSGLANPIHTYQTNQSRVFRATLSVTSQGLRVDCSANPLEITVDVDAGTENGRLRVSPQNVRLRTNPYDNATGTVNVANVGSGELEINDIFLDNVRGQSQIEIFTNRCGDRITLSPGRGCDVTVICRPRCFGCTSTADLRVDSNDPETPRTIVPVSCEVQEF